VAPGPAGRGALTRGGCTGFTQLSPNGVKFGARGIRYVLEEYVAMMTRWSRTAAVMAAFGVGAVVSSPAGAIGPTAFAMSPTSGPGGTEVDVSGTGCAPGLLLSGSLDRVVVSIASAPPTSVSLPVTSGGAWNGTVTVPTDAAAAPALVTAVCFTDGLQSLLTIYTPKTFTVTAAAPPTTAPGPQPATTVPEPNRPPPVTQPPGNDSGPTPTTEPGDHPPTTRPDGGGPVAGGPGGGSGAPGVPEPGGNDGGDAVSGAEKAASGRHAGAVSVAADLQAPDLSSAGAADGGPGLGWIGRLALLLLVAGAVAGALLLRRFRRERSEVSVR
jgi:hypothetical protein